MKKEYYNKPINHNLYGKFEVMGNPGKRTERYLTRQEYLNGENGVLHLDIETGHIIFADERNKKIHMVTMA